MKLHNIPIKKKTAKRVGRGGKRGITSGRGQKGQRSRAGHRIRPALRDTLLRLPKKRGFRNKQKAPRLAEIDLAVLARKIKSFLPESGIISKDILKEARLIPARYRGQVKIIIATKPVAFQAKLAPGVLASAAVTAILEGAKKAAK